MTTTPSLELLAPLSGVLMRLDQVPDPVFSGRLIGDGVCIDPTSSVLCAPLAGVVSNLQDSGHAISITDERGVQLLMHIGLDTVNLAGKGFTAKVAQGERVEAGQALIEFDADYLALHARSLLTLMLVVSGEPFTLADTLQDTVDKGQPLLRLGLSAPADEPLPQELGEALFSRVLILLNANGLHARPAAVLAQAAKGFRASIQLHKGPTSANAKSLVAIMALQTALGDALQISAVGEDAQAAIDALVPLIIDGCGETITADTVLETFSAPEEAALTLLRGVCASPGAAFGRVVQLSEPPLSIQEAGLRFWTMRWNRQPWPCRRCATARRTVPSSASFRLIRSCWKTRNCWSGPAHCWHRARARRLPGVPPPMKRRTCSGCSAMTCSSSAPWTWWMSASGCSG